jgi:type I restriction enzyme S subunit
MGVDMATSQDFVTWTCGERLRPRFLLYVLRAMKQEFKRLVMGSTHKTIYMPDVERISVPLPPLAEQDAVIGALDNEMREMDELGDLLQRQSALLDERRSVLILNTIGGGPTQQAR